MISTSKIDIIWSPVHHDKFIVWGQDITLYEVARLKDIEKKTSFTQISSTRGATVVASQSANGVRCVDVSAISEHPDPILALGHDSGRVSLTSLKTAYDPLGLVGREFVARYPRPCNTLAWSHTESNLLAVGMDKHRTDNCVLLWDINTCSNEEFTGESGSPPGWARARPAAQRAPGEAALGLAWCGFAPRTLAACLNLKHIKLFDLREAGVSGVAGATGAVASRHSAGVCAESGTHQLATRGDSALCVWDARALPRPLLTLPQPRPLRKIQWCPTRRNLLLSLQRDSSAVRLHDIQQAHNLRPQQSFDSATSAASALDEAEAEVCGGGGGGGGDGGGGGGGRSVVEREVLPAAHALLAFACHPQHRARLLALTAAGGVAEYTVCERVTLAWGAGGALAWAGGGALRAMHPAFHLHVDDLAQRTRRRAEADYGLKPDLWQNAELAEDEALAALWHFLALSKSLVEDGCIRNSPWKHPGVRTVLASGTGAGGAATPGAPGTPSAPGVGEGTYRSEAVPSLLPDMPNRKIIVYRSPERTRALQLCGWGWGWENAAAGVERAEAEGTPCRAAALAAFHLRARAALDVLARARDPRLRVAALALVPAPAPAAPAAPDERLWRDALAAAAPALPDPYLRALLHFLAAAAAAPAPHPQPDFSAVLGETGMRLEDRVAFACIYLSDSKLHEYIQSAHLALLQQGDLAGILLTGVSPEGVSLVQRWLERTGDVQSAALLAARCCPPELLRDPAVAHWLDSYRSLLDSWQLWWSRCALDTWVCAGAGAGAEGGRRVGVACTYCGKSVAAAPSARPRPAFARLPPPAAKMKQTSSCPNCRKPLPRCGVCSLHLGTSAVGGAGGAAGGAGGAVGGAGGAVGGAQFAGWFSWCVACRHGGHAAHLLQWFSEHTECPVSSCACRCSSLDPPDRAAPAPPAPLAPPTPLAPPARPT